MVQTINPSTGANTEEGAYIERERECPETGRLCHSPMMKLVFRLSLENEKIHMAGMDPMVIYKVSGLLCLRSSGSE